MQIYFVLRRVVDMTDKCGYVSFGGYADTSSFVVSTLSDWVIPAECGLVVYVCP
jgi:hypothetical protein